LNAEETLAKTQRNFGMGEMVWMTQQQMAELFLANKSGIIRHLTHLCAGAGRQGRTAIGRYERKENVTRFLHTGDGPFGRIRRFFSILKK